MRSERTYSQIYRQAVKILRQAGLSRAELEAGWIVERGLQVNRLALHIEPHHAVTPEACQEVFKLVARRASREPLQYVLGTQEFYGRDMAVGAGVLIPRPESELVVEALLGLVKTDEGHLLIDVGTGSGCLAICLALERPSAFILAVDRSTTAVSIAQVNARHHGVERRIGWVTGDLLTPLLSGRAAGKVTAIVANLPYLSQAEWEHLPIDVKDFEPPLALCGGQDGFDEYRRLFSQAPKVLSMGGFLVIEIGMGQVDLVREEVAKSPRLRIVNIRKDAQGVERVVCLQRHG